MKVDVSVVVTGEPCPVPVIKTRKAIDMAKKGEVIKIIGNDIPSKKQILMATGELGAKLLKVEEKGDKWSITVEKR